MEETENGKLFRMVEVNPVEIKCAECDSFLFEALEEQEVYCSECFNEAKNRKDELQEIVNEVKNAVDTEG